MKILGIDVETTGLDANENSITEIAWAIFDTDDYTKPYAARSFLTGTNDEISEFITGLTGINSSHMEKADTLNEALGALLKDIEQFGIKYVVAHNGQFDINFLNAGFIKCGMGIPVLELIDTAQDIPYPDEITTRTLRFLAVEHGFMNPFPHSAIFDVFCMMKIVAFYHFDDIIKYKNEPTYIIAADVNFHTKEPAKKAGFKWQELNGKVYDKTWVKAVKHRKYDKESETYTFGHRILEEL
jgi:DNA polymerase-3 subunit epsilon